VSRELGDSQDNPLPRPAARVLLFDAARRVLLLHTTPSRDAATYYWMTPGGERRPGESPQQTAERELLEETGIVAPLGPCVWLREFTWRFPGNDRQPPTWFATREHFFIAQVYGERPAVRPSGDGVEMVDLGEARWWSLDELRATDEPLSPLQLVELIEPLVRGELPVAPIRIGR
jgi:8-oxo-dGTP pyrophosphatase MutT (NUDIX family)